MVAIATLLPYEPRASSTLELAQVWWANFLSLFLDTRIELHLPVSI